MKGIDWVFIYENKRICHRDGLQMLSRVFNILFARNNRRVVFDEGQVRKSVSRNVYLCNEKLKCMD